MFKQLISILLLNIIFFQINAKTPEEDYDKAAEDYKNSYIKEFKQKVKDYLTEKNLYNNDKKFINKEEFKEIFIYLMSGGTEENVSEGFGDTFKSLTEEFVNDAFPKGVNSMKGSEVYKYFEYENIMDKFNKYMAKISQQYDPNKQSDL